jgi:TPR repeat protein
MRQHRRIFVTPLLLIACAVAMPIAYYFLSGRLAPEAEPAREPKVAALDSRIVAPPLSAAAQGEFRPNAPQEDNPDSAILSQGGVKSPQRETTAMLSPGPSGVQPPASNVVRRLDPEDIKRLIKQGEQFAAAGDLVTARLVFQRAAEAGDATAALAMGASYDPIVLADLGFRGISADVGKARSWYEKAKEFGSLEASRRLELLAHR